MAWQNRILKIVQKINIKGKNVLLLNKCLSSHTILVKSHNNLSKIYPTEHGILQGSVICATMFLKAINNIFDKISKSTKHIMFTDDCYIYCNEENIPQTSLHALQNWFKESSFKFSSTKSQCIIFNYIHKISQLYLKNLLILINRAIKILGITFDSKLK